MPSAMPIRGGRLNVRGLGDRATCPFYPVHSRVATHVREHRPYEQPERLLRFRSGEQPSQSVGQRGQIRVPRIDVLHRDRIHPMDSDRSTHHLVIRLASEQSHRDHTADHRIITCAGSRRDRFSAARPGLVVTSSSRSRPNRTTTHPTRHGQSTGLTAATPPQHR